MVGAPGGWDPRDILDQILLPSVLCTGMIDTVVSIAVYIVGLADDLWEPSSHVAKDRFKRMIDDMYFSSMRG